ncbi:DUF4397 domain-containing protein [Arthrobacter sunyaminii]|uniref:DUF4397 domain-containing protein n=1 Tax=Arthrobacter sunyaminii TaxID=2816859 RepID=A0A975PEN7_9MICC|nr:DUF4397 domain-containing protein [Arthrobacter sunyaminii]MBO0907597.1 DUF4397 domain-containing protein [Arthrobacter sunyaminii]QWQ35162.1 DUF4397 domain-containing protein [Arthrobacter sunyaminii]
MRKTVTALAAAAGLTAAVGFMTPAAAADTAQLSVLHAVPDTTVDVYVNGALTLDDFTPGTLAGPLDLPGGSYDLAITAPDAADASAPIIGPVTVEMAAGGNYTAVANLDATGKPTANFYTNDLSMVEPGKADLTVRHDAAAPAVDVLANGTPVITGLENPNEKSLTVDAGTISASVAAAGTTDPVIGPADLTLAEGTHTFVYAWGSLEDGNLALATQTIHGMESAPNAVPGALASSDEGNGGALAAGAGVAMMLLVGAAAVARRKHSASAARS